MVRLRSHKSAIYIVDIDRRHGISGNGQDLRRLLLAVISDKEDRVRLTAAECLLLLRDLTLCIDSQQQIIAQMGIIAVFFAIVSDETFVALALPCVRLLLFLPVFGNGADAPTSVTLYKITGLSAWLRIVFAALIGVTVLNGISGFIISRFDKPVWNRHRLVTAIVLSITGAAVFMMTRQPYAGILCLAMLVVKGLLIGKGNVLS